MTTEAEYLNLKRYYDIMTYLSYGLHRDQQGSVAAFVAALQKYKAEFPDAQPALLGYLQRVLVRGIHAWDGTEMPLRTPPLTTAEIRPVLLFRLYGLCSARHGIETLGRPLVIQLQGLPRERTPVTALSSHMGPRNPRGVRPSDVSPRPPMHHGWGRGGQLNAEPRRQSRNVQYRPEPPKKGYSLKRLRAEQDSINRVIVEWNRFIVSQNRAKASATPHPPVSRYWPMFHTPGPHHWPSVERLGLAAIGPPARIPTAPGGALRVMVSLYRVHEIARAVKGWLRGSGLYVETILIPSHRSHHKDVFRRERTALGWYIRPWECPPHLLAEEERGAEDVVVEEQEEEEVVEEQEEEEVVEEQEEEEEEEEMPSPAEEDAKLEYGDIGGWRSMLPSGRRAPPGRPYTGGTTGPLEEYLRVVYHPSVLAAWTESIAALKATGRVEKLLRYPSFAVLFSRYFTFAVRLILGRMANRRRRASVRYGQYEDRALDCYAQKVTRRYLNRYDTNRLVDIYLGILLRRPGGTYTLRPVDPFAVDGNLPTIKTPQRRGAPEGDTLPRQSEKDRRRLIRQRYISHLMGRNRY